MKQPSGSAQVSLPQTRGASAVVVHQGFGFQGDAKVRGRHEGAGGSGAGAAAQGAALCCPGGVRRLLCCQFSLAMRSKVQDERVCCWLRDGLAAWHWMRVVPHRPRGAPPNVRVSASSSTGASKLRRVGWAPLKQPGKKKKKSLRSAQNHHEILYDNRGTTHFHHGARHRQAAFSDKL